MSAHGDLDRFIVSDIEEAKPRLRRLDAIVMRAELIKATRKREMGAENELYRYLMV